MPDRQSLAAGFKAGLQTSQLRVMDRTGIGNVLVHESSAHIEAPNWSPDGQWLLFNSAGRLFRLLADGQGAPEPVAIEPELVANNDHVLSPDGQTIYFSVRGGQVYAVPWAGGLARQVSNDHPPESPHLYFVHGISPDGQTLIYVALCGPKARRNFGLYTIPAAGGPDTALFLPSVPVDGPEYAPDGQWIYYNGEDPAREPGHAQLYRMRADGSAREQLTHDQRVNWFPHASPDGQWLSCISYPPGTRGHPPNRDVQIRVMRPDGRHSAVVARFLGGQGSLNVNSWSPDSQRLAYVAYPRRASEAASKP